MNNNNGKRKNKNKPNTGESQFHLESKNPEQDLAISLFKTCDILFLLGPAGTGKSYLAMALAIKEVLKNEKNQIVLTRPVVEAEEKIGFLPGPQPLDANILTPSGWVKMGDLKNGDLIIGSDGLPTKILKIFPKGKKQVYKIETIDGSSTECCEDHLWLTKTKEDKKLNKSGTVKTTKQIQETILNENGNFNHFLPRNKPIHFEEKDLPIPPYTLGVLLGSKNISNMSYVNVDFIENSLKILGLLNKKHNDNFIPDIYKFSSIEQRLELLKGLTSITSNLNNKHSFILTSKKLAEDTIELIKSLGGKAKLKFNEENTYEVSINLNKKFNQFYAYDNKITKITPTEIKEVQCILIENPEHLYITDGYIVTHNTMDEKLDPYMQPLWDCMDKSLGKNNLQRKLIEESIDLAPIAFLRGRTFTNSVCIFDEAQNANMRQLILYLTRLGENSKMIITGDPNQTDIKESGLIECVNKIKDINGVGVVKFSRESIVRNHIIAKILEKLEK